MTVTLTVTPRGRAVNRVNYCLNPRMIDLSQISGYNGAAVTLGTAAADQISGANSAKVVTNSSTAVQGIIYMAPSPDGSAIGTWTVSVEVSGTLGAVAVFSGRVTSPGGEGLGGGEVTLSGAPQRVSATFTSVGEHANLGFQMILKTPASGRTMRWSRMQIEHGTQMTEWFDGGTPTSGDKTYAYGGQANRENFESITDPVTAPISPLLSIGYETARDSRNVFHDVLGRPDPVLTFRPAALRSGVRDLLFPDEATAVRAFEAHTRPGYMTFTDTDLPLANMRYVINGRLGLRLDDETQRRWILSVPYQEITR